MPGDEGARSSDQQKTEFSYAFRFVFEAESWMVKK